MIIGHFGEIASLITAILWTFSALAFESAGKKVGSLSVNFIRLIIAFVFISIYNYFSRGLLLPVDASAYAWFYLFISGIIGFVLGDLFLFEAFVEIGSRISMLIMSFVPPITGILGFLIMGEVLTTKNIIGMTITISGVAAVILKKNDKESKVEFSHSIRGIIFAFLGAVGQALGMILSKKGMVDYNNSFAATQIRIIAGILGFVVIFFIMRRWSNFFKAFKNPTALLSTSIGAFVGPFLGVSFSLLAIQYTTTAVASTIMAIVPVLIIPPSIIIFKEKITAKEVIGSIITVIGIGILFL